MASDSGRWQRVYAGTDTECFDLTNFVGDVSFTESAEAEIETLYNQSYREVISTLTEIAPSIDFIHRGDATQKIDEWLITKDLAYWGFVWSSGGAPYAAGSKNYAVWGEFAVTSQTTEARQGVNRSTLTLTQSDDVFETDGGVTLFTLAPGAGTVTIPTVAATDRVDAFVFSNVGSTANTRLRIGTKNLGPAINTGNTEHVSGTALTGGALGTAAARPAGNTLMGVLLSGTKVESA